MAEIRHLENRHDVIFFCRGSSDLDKISHCRVLPLAEFTVMIPEPHATLQGVRIPSAILKIVFRHILFFVCFLNAVWALTSGGFCIVCNTLVYIKISGTIADGMQCLQI